MLRTFQFNCRANGFARRETDSSAANCPMQKMCYGWIIPLNPNRIGRGSRIMCWKTERSPAEWFEKAAQWYVEGHQACAWCGGQHCVVRSEVASRIEYYCPACDFGACLDRTTGSYFAAPGHQNCGPVTLRGTRILAAVKPVG